jgi:type II secretory pathway pseudopilin PulG
MNTQFSPAERGISLVEVLVALLILAVVGGSILAGIFTDLKGNGIARTAIAAESLARTEIEYVLSQPYDATNWTYTLPGSPPSNWGAHALSPGYTGYTVTVFPSYPYSGTTAIQKITVVVNYNSSPALTVETYRAQ